MAKAAADAGQAEVVWEPGDLDRAVVARAAAPSVGERAPSAAVDPLGDRGCEDLEAGAEDDRVDLVLGPIAQRSPCGRAPRAHRRYNVDVVLGERGVPVAGDQDALARDLEVGHQLRPQLGVANAGGAGAPAAMLCTIARNDPVAADQPVEQAVADENWTSRWRRRTPGMRRSTARSSAVVARSIRGMTHPGVR